VNNEQRALEKEMFGVVHIHFFSAASGTAGGVNRYPFTKGTNNREHRSRTNMRASRR